MMRFVLWVIRNVTPPADREWVVGDTLEELSRIEAADGRAAARRWLRREAWRVLVWAPRHRRALWRRPAPAMPARKGDGTMHTIWQDVRYAVRTLLHSPGFSLAAVLTLALGIGANTAIFSVIHAVLLRPLPYAAPDRVAMIWDPSRRTTTTWLSLQEVIHYGRASRTFERVTAYDESDATLTGGADPERVRAGVVMTDIFALLGVPPLLGRGFTDDDAAPGATPVVVLSHGLWQRRFGGEPGVLGQDVHLNGTPRTIVGIMPPAFRLPLDYRRPRPTELWVPVIVDGENLGAWGNRWLMGVARLRPGVDPIEASAELDAIARGWIEAGFLARSADGPPRRGAIPVSDFLTGGLRVPLALLLGAVLGVLLTAVTNVVNLLLARASVRDRDLSIRAALGASRRRLVAQGLAESVVLALAGGAAGAALAFGFLRLAILLHAGTLPRVQDAALDSSALAFALAVSLLAGILCGLGPALRTWRRSPQPSLKEYTGARTAGRARRRLRHALVMPSCRCRWCSLPVPCF